MNIYHLTLNLSGRCGSPSTDSARVRAAAKTNLSINMALCWCSRYSLRMRDLWPNHATPAVMPTPKKNAGCKIWRLPSRRRLFTVQEPGQICDPDHRWWTRKKRMWHNNYIRHLPFWKLAVRKQKSYTLIWQGLRNCIERRYCDKVKVLTYYKCQDVSYANEHNFNHNLEFKDIQ